MQGTCRSGEGGNDHSYRSDPGSESRITREGEKKGEDNEWDVEKKYKFYAEKMKYSQGWSKRVSR